MRNYLALAALGSVLFLTACDKDSAGSDLPELTETGVHQFELTVKGSDQIDCLVTCIGTLKSGTAAALYDQNGTSIGAVGQSNFSASSSPKTFVWRTGKEAADMSINMIATTYQDKDVSLTYTLVGKYNGKVIYDVEREITLNDESTVNQFMVYLSSYKKQHK